MTDKQFTKLVLTKKKTGRILTIAHRGFSGVAKDNSMSAISKGLAASYVDGIEFDIQKTRDNLLILSHNRTLVWKSKRYFLHELDLTQIRQVTSSTNAPLFTEVIKLFRTSDKIIDIELKVPGIADRVIRECKATGVYDRVIFSTVYEVIFQEIEKIDPLVAKMLGYPRDRGKDLAQRPWTKPIVDLVVWFMKQQICPTVTTLMENQNASIVSLYHKVLTSEVVSLIHERGGICVGVIINVANDTTRSNVSQIIKEVLAMGIDVIKTDYPDEYAKLSI